ncbi:OsmC family protein [Flavilitoribacter nigricans]|uniref:Osmotically inducible protein OsmC n=1 Tax=Flavilitoribacter nigricans (strain ATCC 23147 / DSM 23189 / NBRC 102662 / NCIMB 1420 / SS-2) TaxID=1122177 RepID=A0A2D0N8B7_FLAN2|nr:OsmC family protein [Flavilitoribacter nigricans]PHN04725.1 osmotically inducible protein OsmC [Flavilitoribacter nigricans DSM 23189 = NBRC 102662]
MINTNAHSVRERQDPLRQAYRTQAELAQITDRAETSDAVQDNPFNGWVKAGNEADTPGIRFGIHRAVGGYHDAPNPGDFLCAALAACLDSTIRIIAERMKVKLEKLTVEVTADVDVRGTLMVSREVPVGFQSINCAVNIQAVAGTDPKVVQTLISTAEHCCVNMQTLRHGTQINTSVNH